MAHSDAPRLNETAPARLSFKTMGEAFSISWPEVCRDFRVEEVALLFASTGSHLRFESRPGFSSCPSRQARGIFLRDSCRGGSLGEFFPKGGYFCSPHISTKADTKGRGTSL